MSTFEEILTETDDGLLKLFFRSQNEAQEASGKAASPRGDSRKFARHLKMTHAQFSCALGFNSSIADLPDIVAIAGFNDYESLAETRNKYFTTDIYDRLGIKDILMLYTHVANDMSQIQLMQYLIKARLENIEKRIEATVNSIIIERYKKEMRSIYNDGVAQIDFAEERLANTHSGFRALLDEVVMIVDSRLIPVGDIFFRPEILPEEKRRLIMRGFIPRDLIEARLADDDVADKERQVLEEQLEQMT